MAGGSRCDIEVLGEDMKVLLINGSPHRNGSTVTALKEAERILLQEGIETEMIHVPADSPGCMASRYCHNNPGCVRKDIVNETYEKVAECDGMIIGSPVYYAGMSGSLKAFLDRLFYSYPSRVSLTMKAGAAISSSRRAGNLTCNDAVNKYFSINGMTTIGSSYWNDAHGNSSEETLQDEEGMQTMRNLARNMAYYVKMRNLAGEQGLEDPVREKKAYTNFIR